MSSPKPNSFSNSPPNDQIGSTCLQGRSQTPDTMPREVLSKMASSPTFTSQPMQEQPTSQTTAPLSPPFISTPNQALVEVDEQFNDAEDEAQLGEDDDTMVLVITPLDEGEAEEDREYEALGDANDTDIGTRISMVEYITISDSEEERSETPTIPQGPTVGIQCGTPPKQYVDVSVQTDDTTPSPDLRMDACNDLLLRRVMQKTEWKDELDKMLIDIRFDLWEKGWVKNITM